MQGRPIALAASWRNSSLVLEAGSIFQLGIKDLGGSVKPSKGSPAVSRTARNVEESRSRSRGRRAAEESQQQQECGALLLGAPHLDRHQARQIACGWQHCLVLTHVGAVFSWGFGGYGALGHGVKYSRKEPQVVDALLGRLVLSVACGSYASSAVTTEGRLYTWGWGT